MRTIPSSWLDEIEKELGIATCPINWPIGSGKKFRGVYDRRQKESPYLLRYNEGNERKVSRKKLISTIRIFSMWSMRTRKNSSWMRSSCSTAQWAEFDQELVSKGELSPVFFGSALTNFGVETFLQHFLTMTMPPLPRTADCGVIDPVKEDFSAFCL